MLYSQRSWQISIHPSVRVLPEDIPAEVSPVLPGIGYLTELNLSPINAPESAKKFALRAASAIAKGSHGVVFDPQEDALVLPTGIRRYAKPAPDENASVMRFSWWFVDGPLTENKFDGLLDALVADLPEAMPRRYGEFEPPQHICRRGARAFPTLSHRKYQGNQYYLVSDRPRIGCKPGGTTINWCFETRF